ncbi:DUF3616 domain-containing protein [Hansschlegelia zhihuaiae]|uniref:DUF3616 domain-containing protein n=1 Tax=Hansschlegelia zhihuaiae TaxID=405005 RepID=A0A4Q0MPF7_9HYPH|nr:DUF3616 domain-containing protein [Hansschlegelia zhihuaiae]RXF74936.1 DUF3616 domain-containing protein [Hansschlegelia zhihuaiae]
MANAKAKTRTGGETPSLRMVAAGMRDVEAGEAPEKVLAWLGVKEDEFARLSKVVLARRRPRRVGQIPLVFHDPSASKGQIREDVSAIAAIGEGESLWVGADEGASLERLTVERDKTGRVVGFGRHVRYDLHDFFDFPNGVEQEADIEGLAVADGFLWVVGSHSLKRKKPGGGDTTEQALDKLTHVEQEANRFLLGRIPLIAGDRPGVPTLAAAAPALDGGKRDRRAGALRMTSKGSALSKHLHKDEHLGPFMAIPSKDNGLDVEGMVVVKDRIFLGLRGPVLRGWATILEMKFNAKKSGRLKLKKFEDGDLIRRHFLDLDGLGVRSLLVDGQDLVILAGPTMDLDGPVRLYRWRGGLGAQDSSVAPRETVERTLDLPFGPGDEHAEGATMVRMEPGARPVLLVAYDTPARARLLKGGGVLADLFEAPEPL